MVVSARWTRAIHLELLEVQRQRTGSIPNMQEHTYLTYLVMSLKRINQQE